MAIALADEIRAALALHADPQRALQQQAYMKSELPYWGLTAPQLTSVLRPILADGVGALGSRAAWEVAIRELWDTATHREEWYAAISIARHRHAAAWRAEGALDLYRHLVETGAWWDVVDEVATHLVRDELLAEPDRVTPMMRTWAVDPVLWIRRAAIICQVGARQRTNLDLLAAAIVANLERSATAPASGRQDFFVREAIGWALRDAGSHQPGWVRQFVAVHRDEMAGLTVREALKHLG